jgi:hypothetical protein
MARMRINHKDTKDTKEGNGTPLNSDRSLLIRRRCHAGPNRFFVLFVSFVSLWFIIAGRTPAEAQSFGPPVPTQTMLVLLDKSGHPRFTLSSYVAEWENPFRITVRTFSPALLQVVSGQVRLNGDTSASPLFEATYSLDRHWAIGGWYNPIHDSAPQKVVQIADAQFGLGLSRDADLADFHVMYYAPHGLTAQIGYYRETGTYHLRESDLGNPPTYQTSSQDYSLVSWNLWVTERLDVRARGRVITPFVSFGWHPSTGLEHATSFLGGAAVTLNERISLSASVWLFDLSHTATRITGGVVYRL